METCKKYSYEVNKVVLGPIRLQVATKKMLSLNITWMKIVREGARPAPLPTPLPPLLPLTTPFHLFLHQLFSLPLCFVHSAFLPRLCSAPSSFLLHTTTATFVMLPPSAVPAVPMSSLSDSLFFYFYISTSRFINIYLRLYLSSGLFFSPSFPCTFHNFFLFPSVFLIPSNLYSISTCILSHPPQTPTL